MSESPITVFIPVHGGAYQEMYALSVRASGHFVPRAEFHAFPYEPPSRYRTPAHAGDWAKAQITSFSSVERPIFVMDADSILVRETTWPEIEKDAVLVACVSLDHEIKPDIARGQNILRDAAKYAGVLGRHTVADMNPQFFWVRADLRATYDEMESAVRGYLSNRPDDEFMLSLATWTLTWLKLESQAKAGFLAGPLPVQHCYMIGSDRLVAHRIFTDWMGKQSPEDPVLPDPSLFPTASSARSPRIVSRASHDSPAFASRSLREIRGPDIFVQRYYKPDGRAYRPVPERRTKERVIRLRQYS